MAKRKPYYPQPSNRLDQTDQIAVAAGYGTFKQRAKAAVKRARKVSRRGAA